MSDPQPLPDVMVDIETLGISDNALIIQIGAVRFDGDSGLISSPEGAFCFNVDPEKDSANGVLDLSTVLWWMRQSDPARRRVFQSGWDGSLRDACESFRLWLEKQGNFARIWGTGPQFDLRLLAQAHARVGMKAPWSYGRERDFRTLRQVGRMIGVEEPLFVGVKHDALDDAFHQAGWSIQILRRLKEVGEAARVPGVGSEPALVGVAAPSAAEAPPRTSAEGTPAG